MERVQTDKRLMHLFGQLVEDVYSIHGGNPKKKKSSRSKGMWKMMGYIIIPFHKSSMTCLYHLVVFSQNGGRGEEKSNKKKARHGGNFHIQKDYKV